MRHNEVKGNISPNETDQHTPELEILDKERQYVLDLILKKMGKTCREVLKLWAMKIQHAGNRHPHGLQECRDGQEEKT